MQLQVASWPDEGGHFGIYGGRYAPETLMSALIELEKSYLKYKDDPEFVEELTYYLREYAGRPTSLYFARRLTEHLGGAKIYLKREDLCHTGAHKINNTLGQVLLAKRMNKTRIIAETGAGQHGVATATVAAMFGMSCEIFMGTEDMERQALNVFRMRLLGATVTPVESGSRTLKDAVNEAFRDWVDSVESTYYIFGSVLGPHPYPMMVRDFQSVIGREARLQIVEKEGKLPDLLMACVGGGSNSMGLFYHFLEDEDVKMVGVEAGGLGIASGKHAARFETGTLGVLHGTKSFILQDEHGQIRPTHSVSAGLDYPSVGPEHSLLRDMQRVQYTYATDQEALDGFQKLSELEGIIPALESAHAVAYLVKVGGEIPQGHLVIVCMSGRGDKDVQEVARLLEEKAKQTR